MANTKNTIQNIPLEAPLCMNVLKTDVKQFQGFNEKNSTVFGGTLSPMFDKKTELPFNMDSSYTFFNTKGVPYTLVRDTNDIKLYKNGETEVTRFRQLSKTENLNVPEDTFMAARVNFAKPGETGDKAIHTVRVDQSGYIYLDDTKFGDNRLVPSTYSWVMTNCQLLSTSPVGIVIAATCTRTTSITYGYQHLTIVCVYNESGTTVKCETLFSVDEVGQVGKVPFLSFGKISHNVDVYYYPISGFNDIAGSLATNNGLEYIKKYSIYVPSVPTQADKPKVVEGTNPTTSNKVVIESLLSPGDESLGGRITPVITDTSMNIQRFAGRRIGRLENDGQYFPNYLYYSNNSEAYRGQVGITDKIRDIPLPLGVYSNDCSVYYQGDGLISVGVHGITIDSCLSYSSNIVTPCKYHSGNTADIFVSYKKGNSWYCYSYLSSYEMDNEDIIKVFKRMVFDGRYVIIQDNSSGLMVYDIEQDDIEPQHHLDWIINEPAYPIDPTLEDSYGTTGAVFGAGVNAPYQISNSLFVGYLPNPFVSVVSSSDTNTGYFISAYTPDDVQYYLTIDDTAQSATYVGKDPEYYNALYPIDPNGNIVIPISVNAEIVDGYSNNDMVREGSIVFPLMYWNNNQKTYTYFLLSAIENIDGTFILQGQQFTFDDENIYSIEFNSGITSNIRALAYKKNLRFVGTLPTQALFWSDFNKTFYSFTGDRVLSKMFEASDINEIYFPVSQNPATQSLWIPSDNGIYVLSNTDQFRIELVADKIMFSEKDALIVEKGTGAETKLHSISLYKKDGEDGEIIPLKFQTAYYGLGSEQKAVMDCWYIRVFDDNRSPGKIKVKTRTITNVTMSSDEKEYEIEPSAYDENNIAYIRHQPKYQECVAMQLELETNIGIYSLALGVNATDAAAQISKFNF